MFENIPAEELQLLNMDLGTMDTSFPMGDPGIYDFRVTKSEIVPVKDASKGNMWKLTFTSTTPIPGKNPATQQAVTIEAGKLTLFDQAILNPMGKAKWSDVARGVAKLVQACKLGSVQLPAIETWHKQAEGRVVRIRVGVAPQRTDPVTGAVYAARNSVEEYPKN